MGFHQLDCDLLNALQVSKGCAAALSLPSILAGRGRQVFVLYRANYPISDTTKPQYSGYFMRNLTFYTTAGCHLCVLAADLISQLESKWDIAIVEIDIVTDEKLTDRYGTRIPVVSRDDTQRELSWPFTLEELENFAAP